MSLANWLLVFEDREIERVERLGAEKGIDKGFSISNVEGCCDARKVDVVTLLSFDQSSSRTYNEVPTLKAYPMCKMVPCDVYPRPVYEGEVILTPATPSDPLQNKAHLVIIGHGVAAIGRLASSALQKHGNPMLHC
ncbi:hypothetical protein Tco_1323927 [Tanacetum coccineum]